MNYQKISHDITKFLVTSLYSFDHPITSEMRAAEINTREQLALETFISDPIFNAKVRTLTTVLIRIIQHHEDIEKHSEIGVIQRRKRFDETNLENLYQIAGIGRISVKEFLNCLNK